MLVQDFGDIIFISNKYINNEIEMIVIARIMVVNFDDKIMSYYIFKRHISNSLRNFHIHKILYFFSYKATRFNVVGQKVPKQVSSLVNLFIKSHSKSNENNIKNKVLQFLCFCVYSQIKVSKISNYQ